MCSDWGFGYPFRIVGPLTPEQPMTTDPTPEEQPTKAEDSQADAMDDFELPTQQEGAQRMIVCEGGCE